MSYVIAAGTIGLAGARMLVDAAVSDAQSRDLRVCVAVTGIAGDLVAFARMYGVPPLAGETARRKCWSVVTTRKSTREFGAMLKSDLDVEPELFHGMLKVGDMVAIEGGVPLIASGLFIGAVAVSGASSEEDHAIAAGAAELIATHLGDNAV